MRGERTNGTGRKTKRVYITDLDTGESTVLAAFRFDDDGNVHAQWFSDWFRRDIERHGIAVAAGVFHPRDGADFYDALELAYSQSTLISVAEITDPAAENTPRAANSPRPVSRATPDSTAERTRSRKPSAARRRQR